MFRVYLPATVSQEAQRAYEVQEQLARGNGELVLVVDDEPNIGNVTAEILEQYGYRTLFAHDGTEALAIYVQKKSEIQIVVTDIMMPYMDGNALIRALRKMDPSIKILATSGLAKNRSEVEHEGRPVPFLAKPYTTERLLTTLSQINAG